jgi:hypothetical protein
MVGLPFGGFLGGAALDLAVQPHLLHAPVAVERVVGTRFVDSHFFIEGSPVTCDRRVSW